MGIAFFTINTFPSENKTFGDGTDERNFMTLEKKITIMRCYPDETKSNKNSKQNEIKGVILAAGKGMHSISCHPIYS